jgi:esterase/lipase
MSEYAEAARPFLLGKGKNAVLVIHGFTGAPYEMN